MVTVAAKPRIPRLPDPTMVLREDRGGVYYFRFSFQGKAYNPPTGSKNLTEATKIAKKFARDLWEEACKAIREKSEQKEEIDQGATLSGTIAHFLRENYDGAPASTTAKISRVLGYLTSYAPSDYLRDLADKAVWLGEGEGKPGILARYKSDHKPAPATWRDTLNYWKGLINYAVDNDLLPKNPIHKVKGPGSGEMGRRLDIWTTEQYETFIDYDGSDPLYVECTLIAKIVRWTGLDEADIFQLTPRHFIKDRKGHLTLYKRRAKAKRSQKECNYKQPIDPEIAPVIKALLATAKGPDDRFMSRDYEDTERSRNNWVGMISKRRHRRFASLFPGEKMLDYKHLRHTFATYMAAFGGPDGKGVPIHVLREWMGHAPGSRVLEEVYLHLSETSQYVRKAA